MVEAHDHHHSQVDDVEGTPCRCAAQHKRAEQSAKRREIEIKAQAGKRSGGRAGKARVGKKRKRHSQADKVLPNKRERAKNVVSGILHPRGPLDQVVGEEKDPGDKAPDNLRHPEKCRCRHGTAAAFPRELRGCTQWLKPRRDIRVSWVPSEVEDNEPIEEQEDQEGDSAEGVEAAGRVAGLSEGDRREGIVGPPEPHSEDQEPVLLGGGRKVAIGVTGIFRALPKVDKVDIDANHDGCKCQKGVLAVDLELGKRWVDGSSNHIDAHVCSAVDVLNGQTSLDEAGIRIIERGSDSVRSIPQESHVEDTSIATGGPAWLAIDNDAVGNGRSDRLDSAITLGTSGTNSEVQREAELGIQQGGLTSAQVDRPVDGGDDKKSLVVSRQAAEGVLISNRACCGRVGRDARGVRPEVVS
jgi:hypothetical protein